MRTLATLAILGSLLGACSGDQASNSNSGGGEAYKTALSLLVQSADRIVATEHSDEQDFSDADRKTEVPEQILYGTVELSSAQRAFFLSTIKSLDPTTQDAFAACVPAIHHTFTFYAKGKLLDSLDICFECGQVLWSGTKATPPWSLYSGLAKVVEHVGLSPEREWAAVARERSRDARLRR